MRRRVLRRLIWVYAVCMCSFFACLQPIPKVSTINFRLATPPEDGNQTEYGERCPDMACDLCCGISWSYCHALQSKEEGRYQESIQSNTIPDPAHHMGKWQKHNITSHTREPQTFSFWIHVNRYLGKKAQVNYKTHSQVVPLFKFKLSCACINALKLFDKFNTTYFHPTGPKQTQWMVRVFDVVNKTTDRMEYLQYF